MSNLGGYIQYWIEDFLKRRDALGTDSVEDESDSEYKNEIHDSASIDDFQHIAVNTEDERDYAEAV